MFLIVVIYLFPCSAHWGFQRGTVNDVVLPADDTESLGEAFSTFQWSVTFSWIGRCGPRKA